MTDQPVKRYEDVPAIRLCSRAALDEFLSRYWPELLRQINDFSRTDAARVEAERLASDIGQLNNMLRARIAELESDLSAVTASSVEHAKTIDGLRAELARARLNAERYEWLRDQGNRERGAATLLYFTDCDAAIDAAIAARSATHSEGEKL